MEAISIYILKSAGLLSLFYLVYISLLKNDTSFRLNRKFLILGILAAVLLPAAVFTKTIQVESQQLALDNFNISKGFTGNISTLQPEQLLSGWQIAAIIYLLGLSFFLIRFGFQLLSLIKIIRNQPKLKEPGISILYTDEKIPPFSFFKYIILNPKWHSPEELEIILQHEKIHAAQNHSADVLIANLTAAILWFNPLAWLYKESILQNLEFIADKETVAKNISRKQYQETLLKVCLANFQPALSNSFYQSFIKKRILMLHKKSTSNNFWKMTVAIPLVLAFLLVFNVKTVAQVKTSEDKTTGITTEEYSASISMNSSQENLEYLKKFMQKRNLMLTYEDIKRSPEGLLTSITVNFFNKINNNSGSITKNDAKGISSFVIYVNKDGETGVTDAPDFPSGTKNSKERILAEIGLNPLFIINNKEYQATQLYGKSIHLKSGFVFISPDEASADKKNGTKAKDGIIVVSEGEIIADFAEEMKKLDDENKKTTANYIQIEEGSKPTFITVEKNPKKPQNPEKSQTKKKRSSEKEDEQNKSKKNKDKKVMVIGTKVSIEEDPVEDIYAYQNGSKSNPITSVNYQNKEKPLFVLDDIEMEKEFYIKSVNPEDIASLNVLKGENAVQKYGKEGKNGVIEIKTKKAFQENSSKIFEIKSSFSDAQLDALKGAAKQQNDFKLKFKNIKRNPEGLISSIGVSLKGKDQREASASYKDEDGIPTIYVGENKAGGVIVTSDPVK